MGNPRFRGQQICTATDPNSSSSHERGHDSHSGIGDPASIRRFSPVIPSRKAETNLRIGV
jgi:hypothetical protein